MTGVLTLRGAGIAGAVAGAVALAVPFAPAAWKWFWPDPIATIDVPKANASRAGCFLIKGSLVPSTFWRRPLWLIAAPDGRGWHPVTRIAPWGGEWRTTTCVRGRTGDKNRFALVVADGDRDEAFARELVAPHEEIPDWLKSRKDMEQGGRGRRRGFDPIPAGAGLVASVQVDVREGDEQPWLAGLHGGDDWYLSGTDERQGRRRHDERRVVGSRVGLQGAVVRAVPAGGHRIGGRRP